MINLSQAKQLIKGLKILQKDTSPVDIKVYSEKRFNEWIEMKDKEATLSTTKLWVQDKIEGLKKDIEFLNMLYTWVEVIFDKTDIDINESKRIAKVREVFGYELGNVLTEIKKQLQAKETELKEILEVKEVLGCRE